MKQLIKIIPLAALFSLSLIGHAADYPKVIRFVTTGSSYSNGIPGPAIVNVIDTQNLLKEEFKKEGIKIEEILVKNAGPGINETIAANLADFGSCGDFPLLIGKAGGLRTKYIIGTERGYNTYVIARPELHITSVQQLKGRKVAYLKGTNGHLNFINVLESHGLTEKDIKGVNLSGSDGQAALAAGSVDAISSGYDRPLVDQGVAVEVYNTRHAPLNSKPRSGLVVTEEFAQKYPDITKRVVKVFIKAAYWASQDKNREAITQLQVKAGNKYKYIIQEYDGLTNKQKFNPLITQDDVDGYKKVLAFADKRKLIRKTFDIEKWVDKSYSEAAVKELGLANFWATK